MIALNDFKEAGIPLSGEDASELLKAIAALEWISENTSLEVSTEDPAALKELPASAKLFVSKYVEILSLKSGVSSQSIEGLSLSFETTDKSTMLWQLAQSLLGKHLRQVRFHPAKRRW